VANLPDEDLVPMLAQTFSIILRYWSDFDVAAANIAQEMVSYMLEKRPVILKESIAFIPSMASIPVFAKIESRLVDWRSEVSPQKRLHQLALRCGHENVIVVEYALIELRECIKQNQSLIHTSAGHEKPDPVVPELIRCLLDVVVTFKDPDLKARPRIARLCAECLGLIGAVNPNTVESGRVKQEMAVLHNFSRADESADFALFFLEKVLVKQFLAATDTKSQGFLAWCAQELLRFCTVNNQIIPSSRRTESAVKTLAQARWDKLQPAAQEALLPFLKSKYSLSGKVIRATFSYPLFKYGITYREWLISIITELLCKPVGHNAEQIFNACVRICRGQDVSISKFLFPHAVLHIAVGGREEDRQNIITEFLAVLRYNSKPSDPPAMKETLRQCTETIFSVVDHMAKWLRDKSEDDLRQRTQQARQQNRHYDVEEEDGSMDPAVPRVKRMLEAIPPDLMAYRSLEFHSYARALLCWEQHIRHKRVEKNNNSESDLEPLYEQLQHIYTHVDEPDGMAGISAKIPTLEIDQQILEHRKAGKWTAAQSWYELLLADNPGEVETQVNLISCLRDSGQHDALLKHVDGMLSQSPESHNRLLPYAVEASWVSGKWDALEKYLSSSNERTDLTYNIRVGYALSELRKQNMEEFMKRIDSAREGIAGMMTESATGSIRQCHPFLVQLHALSELQGISKELHQPQFDKSRLIQHYESRLNLMGTYSKDKRYILAVRRAAFQLSG
jgi:serine/threonine-protein kinase ATR